MDFYHIDISPATTPVANSKILGIFNAYLSIPRYSCSLEAPGDIYPAMATDTLKIGIVMDPIESITPYKDSSLAMLLEAERRNAEIHYFQQQDLRLLNGKALGRSLRLTVRDDNENWFSFGDSEEIAWNEDVDEVLLYLWQKE